MKKALFIDRDGTLIAEPPVTYQVDTLEKLEFIPGVFRSMYAIRRFTDFELVLVSNQDGMGTEAYPEESFRLVHDRFLKAFENEGVVFDAQHIDPTLPEENAPTRKPGTAMLTSYLQGDYDLESSWVIGDRLTDLQLAVNLGCKAIWFQPEEKKNELAGSGYESSCLLVSDNWDRISGFLRSMARKATVTRQTNETAIRVELSLDGTGRSDITTGLGFFDHMLDQLARHGSMDLVIKVKGDLEVDEHHTIEDTALALGEAFRKALGNKRGLNRYGFTLPMDDALASVAVDLGGRPWLIWDVEFHREKIGDFPTEMFFHFFKSFSDAALCNLNIKAEGRNEHHLAEAVFKAFSKALKQAAGTETGADELPSTKGVL